MGFLFSTDTVHTFLPPHLLLPPHTSHHTAQHSTQHTAHSTQHTAHSTQHSTQHTAHSMHNARCTNIVCILGLYRGRASSGGISHSPPISRFWAPKKALRSKLPPCTRHACTMHAMRACMHAQNLHKIHRKGCIHAQFLHKIHQKACIHAQILHKIQ